MRVKLLAIVVIFLFFANVFMYEYIPSGDGFIFKINRCTHQAYYFHPSNEAWEKIN